MFCDFFSQDYMRTRTTVSSLLLLQIYEACRERQKRNTVYIFILPSFLLKFKYNQGPFLQTSKTIADCDVEMVEYCGSETYY